MRNMGIWFVVLLAFLALGLGGCARGSVPSPAPSAGLSPPSPTGTPAESLTGEQKFLKEVLERNGFGKLDSKPTILVVRKLPRKLVVYRGLTPLKTYPIVLGANPKNDKMYQGDLCTPEGVYRVVTKFDHPRWDKFILLDYPNTQNWLRFGRAKRAGLIPPDADIGGQIGIHGTHDPALNYRGENWTRGCVSLLNQDIDEIYPLVNPENTLVVIKKE